LNHPVLLCVPCFKDLALESVQIRENPWPSFVSG
jgi:hypothetical protein